MFKSYLFFLLLFCTFSTWSQCENDEVLYFDSTGNNVKATALVLPVYVHNVPKELRLESLHLSDFNSGRMSTFPIGYKEDAKSYLPNLEQEKENEKLKNTFDCIKCRQETIEIADSVDVNGDGIKELVLLREGACYSSPRIPIGCCGVGMKDQSASQYEIWDPVTQTCLFIVRWKYSFSEAVTTNVSYSDQYQFDVEIDKKGQVYLSNLIGDKHFCTQEMGTFRYDEATKKYKKK